MSSPLVPPAGGVLCFWEAACEILDVGKIMADFCLGKNDTPLASMFSLAGCSFFQQS